MARWIASITLLAALALAGCVDHTTAPTAGQTITPVRGNSGPVPLTLKLSSDSGSPADPVVATGSAVNNSTATVAYPDGCAPYAGVYFEAYDQEGQRLQLTDPAALPPMCPVGLQAMAPGQTVSGSLTFNGTLFHPTGGSYMAPPGTYTIVAHLWLYDSHSWSAPNQVIEARASIRWGS